MKLFKIKPTTNGLRHQIKIDKASLIKNTRVFKSLLTNFKEKNGRSPSTGHITSWHKGGGNKKLYRIIDIENKPKKAIVIGINYDPNRSAFISTNFNLKTKKFYNDLAINKVCTGSLIMTNNLLSELKLGFRTQLSNLPIGTILNNISQGDNGKAKYVKSAGVSAQLIQIGQKTAQIKLPSNTMIKLPIKSFANLGVISNTKHNLICLGKAGRNRHLNRRPITRGIAMNPVDHPHGGRTNGGRPSVTPWGLPTKSKFYLKRRSKINKHAQI
jgi:large subunit ribosomal protein L2